VLAADWTPPSPPPVTPSLRIYLADLRSPISDHLAYTILVSFPLSPSRFNNSQIHLHIGMYIYNTHGIWHITYSRTPTFGGFWLFAVLLFSKDQRILYESRKRVFFPAHNHTHTRRPGSWCGLSICVSAPLFVHSQIVLLLPWHAFAVFFCFFPIRFCFVNTHRHTHTPGRRRTHGYTYTSAAALHTHTHLGQRERSLSRVELNASAFQVQVSYPYLWSCFAGISFLTRAKSERKRESGKCICVSTRLRGERVYPWILSGPSMRLKIFRLRFSFNAIGLKRNLDYWVCKKQKINHVLH